MTFLKMLFLGVIFMIAVSYCSRDEKLLIYSEKQAICPGEEGTLICSAQTATNNETMYLEWLCDGDMSNVRTVVCDSEVCLMKLQCGNFSAKACKVNCSETHRIITSSLQYTLSKKPSLITCQSRMQNDSIYLSVPQAGQLKQISIKPASYGRKFIFSMSFSELPGMRNKIEIRGPNEFKCTNNSECFFNDQELQLTVSLDEKYFIDISATACNGSLISNYSYVVNIANYSYIIYHEDEKVQRLILTHNYKDCNSACFDVAVAAIAISAIGVFLYLMKKLCFLLAKQKKDMHGPRALAIKRYEYKYNVFACHKQQCKIDVYTCTKNGDIKISKSISLRRSWWNYIDYITLANPRGIAVDDDGNIYISDSYSHTLYKFNNKGKLVRSVSGCGKDLGKLHSPKGIVFVNSLLCNNLLFVCDLFNQRVQCFDSVTLEPKYAIYILKKSNICPFHIAAGEPSDYDSVTLYITGTNRIYICEVTHMSSPEQVKATNKCSVMYYTHEEREHKLQRIGGIAVKEDENNPNKVKIFVTEIFQDSAIQLELDHSQTQEVRNPGIKKHNKPRLLGYVNQPPNVCPVHESQNELEFPIFTRNHPKKPDKDPNPGLDPEEQLKKPHPIIIGDEFLIISTDAEPKSKTFLKKATFKFKFQ